MEKWVIQDGLGRRQQASHRLAALRDHHLTLFTHLAEPISCSLMQFFDRNRSHERNVSPESHIVKSPKKGLRGSVLTNGTRHPASRRVNNKQKDQI